MSKCKICKADSVYVWQPFGPAEDARLLCTPGWFYRGFTALAVCKTCGDKISSGTPFTATITHKKRQFTIVFDGTKVSATQQER